MPRGRPIPPLTLATEERETLECWIRGPKTAQALAQRGNSSVAFAGALEGTARQASVRTPPHER